MVVKIRGTDFVMYPVKSTAESLVFYGDTLGMRVEGEYAEGKWVELEAPPTTLALYQPDEPHAGPSDGEGTIALAGGPTIALAVEDVDSAIDELREKGVPIVWRGESPACHFVVIRDPDNNRVILHQRKDGTCG